MKKIFSNNRLIAVAFFTVFSVAAAPFAQASDSSNHHVMHVELKYLGNIKNQQLFQLNVASIMKDDEFTIIITDDYGSSLYRENVKGENFIKKFLLNTDEIGDNTLRFEIFCNRTKKSVVYEVNRNTRLIQDIVINEVK